MNVEFRYLAYGVRVDSEVELSLPPAPSGASSLQNGWRLRLARPPFAERAYGRSRDVTVSHGRQLRVHCDSFDPADTSDRPWMLEVEGVARFHVDSGRAVVLEPLCAGDPERIEFWLVHQVVPMLRAFYDEMLVLHAACVAMHGRAVLLCGDSGAGKSTLLEALLARGHGLLADDKVAIEFGRHGPVAVPSHPRFRAGRDFEALGAVSERFCTEPVPLAAAVFLERNDGASVRSTGLRGAGAAVRLAEHAIFDLASRQGWKLAQVGRLANAIGTYVLQRPWGFERLPDACDELEQLIASPGDSGIAVSRQV